MNVQYIWLWIGGVIGVLTMGALRFIGKETSMLGLVAAMVLVIFVLATAVIKYMNKKW